MAKEFLVEAWDPLIWHGDRELSLTSNWPLENLLAERQVEDVTDILLMEMEDIGHFLKTIGSLKEQPKRPSPRKLHFQVVDPDAVAMARNCLMLEIALTINVQNKEDLSFLWCVWYNMELSQAHYARLLGCLQRMIESEKKDSCQEHLKMYDFGDEPTRHSCIDVWRAWMREKHSVEVVTKHRNRAINALDPTILANSTQYGMEVPDHAGGDIKVWDKLADSIAFRWTGCMDPRDMEECSGEIKSWCMKGSALPKSWGTVSGSTAVNPTMMRPGKEEWYGFQGPGPFMIKNRGLTRPKAQKSAIDVCREAFEDLLIDFHEHVGSAQIQVTLWHEDYMKRCLVGFQPGTAFDIIHTGGSIPALEPVSIFLVCAPLLTSPASVLLTAVCHRIGDRGWDNITSFMKDCLKLGCHSHMLPTLFGVHFAEDDDLGATLPPFKTPSLLRWTKAFSFEKEKLCLKESPQVKEAMKTFFQKCFTEKLDGLDTNCSKTPLTALTVLMRLERYVLGGMSQLLTITDELRPQWTTSREDPFHLSWRAQLAAHGYLDLARVHGDDELLHIRTTITPPKRRLCGPTGRVYSQLILAEGDIEQLERISRMEGIVSQIERVRRLVEETRKHIFKNFKYHEATQVVEWLMLKSDWSNLTPTTMVWLEPNEEVLFPLAVKNHATIQTVWKVQQKTNGKVSCSLRPDDKELVKTIKITESLESYSVYLEVLGSDGSVKVETKKGVSPYVQTNKLKLSISDKKRNTTHIVVFSCNIDTTGVRLSVTDQRVTAQVPKHELWNTGPAMLPQLPVKLENLPPISTARVKELLEDDCLLASMFLRPGDLLPWKNSLTMPDLSFSFRICLEQIWKLAYKEPQVTLVGIYGPTDTLLTQLDLVIKGYYVYNGLPLLHIVYHDVRVGQALLSEGNISAEQLRRKRAERQGHHYDPNSHQVHLEPSSASMVKTEEQTIELLRKVLLLNSFRIRQSEADRKLGLSESFLQLYFPRFVRNINDHMIEKQMVASVIGDPSTCKLCATKMKTRPCARCKRVYYCSKECQTVDWSKHKTVCKPYSSDSSDSPYMSMKRGFLLKEEVTQNHLSQESAAGPAPDARTQTARGTQSPLPEGAVSNGHQSGVQKSPAKQASTSKQSRPLPECKICHKSGDDLEARLAYYCSIKCHEEDKGKTYPVAWAHPNLDPGAEGISVKETSGKDSLERQPTAATEPKVTQKKHCDFCGRRSTTSVPCKQCSRVNYCSSSCASADWEQHSTECLRK